MRGSFAMKPSQRSTLKAIYDNLKTNSIHRGEDDTTGNQDMLLNRYNIYNRSRGYRYITSDKMFA